MANVFTTEGYAKQKESLDALNKKLQKLRAERSAAFTRDGDGPHDNPAFHSLDLEEYSLSRKAKELSDRLKSATVVPDGPRNIEAVRIRSIVQVLSQDEGGRRTKVYEIVGTGESDLDRDQIAYDSPIGDALLGTRIGDSIAVDLPEKRIELTVKALFSDWSEVR